MGLIARTWFLIRGWLSAQEKNAAQPPLEQLNQAIERLEFLTNDARVAIARLESDRRFQQSEYEVKLETLARLQRSSGTEDPHRKTELADIKIVVEELDKQLEQIRTSQQTLVKEVKEIRSERDRLAARLTTAEARQHVYSIKSGIDQDDARPITEALDGLVRRAEARAEALRELI